MSTAALWIVITPYVLARLGPERFGIWSLFFAFNGYLITMDLGIGNTLLRYVALYHAAGDRTGLTRVLRRGLLAGAALGVVWALLIVLLRGWFARIFHVPPALLDEALVAALIFAVWVLMIFPVQAMMASLQGFERFDLANTCVVVNVATQMLALWIGLRAGGGLQAAALAGVLGQVASGVVALILVRRLRGTTAAGGKAVSVSTREMMGLGATLQVLGVLIVLQNQCGRLILGLLGNLSMVAEYELAFRVSYAAYSIPILVRDAVIPAVTRVEHQEGQDAVTHLFFQTSRWVYLATAFTLGMLWLLARDLVMAWLGPGHDGVAELVRLWAIAFSVCLAYSPGVAIARGLGRPRAELLSYAAALAIHVAAALAWFRLRASAGVVSASIASFGAGFVVFVILFHRSSAMPFQAWFRGHLLPRALAGLIAVAAIHALMTLAPVAGSLPAPGWTRGAITAGLFSVTFALLFAGLGDTQNVLRSLRQMARARVGSGG